MIRKIVISIGLLAIGLFMASCGGSGDTASVVINPPGAEVQVNHTQQFEGYSLNLFDDSVSWSIQEAGGGTITSAGLYTAPNTVGTYHVIATSKADTSVKATVTVVVITSG